MTKQQSQNLLRKVDLLSTIRNNKFITQGENLETVRDSESESCCIEYIVKFESVYLHDVHVIKKHRNNILFSYYELGFRCFELNLFSHCFDSVRFEKI